MLEGAFAFLIMTANRIYACRDKYGLRPLSIGRLGDGWVVSSETCAFDVLGAEFVRDVEPGEIVTIDKQGIRSRDYSMYKRHEMCSMEYIYFARPDSDIDGCNVHAYRKESGRLLFGEAPAEADIVVGVPDSSLSAAMGYAEASGLPYEMGLIKNKYIGRTFIQPSQELREKGVRMKLSAVRSIVKASAWCWSTIPIVRGTTSRRIVTMLKEAGATEVHVRIASPPMTHPCFYGVDTSTRDELISARKNTAGSGGDMRRFAGVPLARGAAEGGEPQGTLHGLLHGAVSHGVLPVARRRPTRRRKMLADAKRSLRGRRSDAAI